MLLVVARTSCEGATYKPQEAPWKHKGATKILNERVSRWKISAPPNVLWSLARENRHSARDFPSQLVASSDGTNPTTLKSIVCPELDEKVDRAFSK